MIKITAIIKKLTVLQLDSVKKAFIGDEHAPISFNLIALVGIVNTKLLKVS